MQDFKQLIAAIEQVHRHLQDKVVSAVNQALTIRNFLVGYYIVEFEQNRNDRSSYGTKLQPKLAKTIATKGLTASELSSCRQFYQCYSKFLGSLPQSFSEIIPENIFGLLPQYSESGLVKTKHSSAYSIQLPSTEQLQQYIEKNLKNLDR